MEFRLSVDFPQPAGDGMRRWIADCLPKLQEVGDQLCQLADAARIKMRTCGEMLTRYTPEGVGGAMVWQEHGMPVDRPERVPWTLGTHPIDNNRWLWTCRVYLPEELPERGSQAFVKEVRDMSVTALTGPGGVVGGEVQCFVFSPMVCP